MHGVVVKRTCMFAWVRNTKEMKATQWAGKAIVAPVGM